MSCAFSWYRDDGTVESAFVVGEDAVGDALRECNQTPLVVHNYQFEAMVTRCRYPALNINIVHDTMRLAQVYDNGGDKNAFEVLIDEDQVYDEGELPEVKKVSTSGLGLVKCAFRILGKTRSHKETAHRWIRDNVPKSKGKEGQFLDRLPPELLREYNVADTETTLELYTFITDYFKEIGYDWTLDHALYKSTARFLVDAKIRGVIVDRELAANNRAIISQAITDIEKAFADKFAVEIADLERKRALSWVMGPKTEKGRLKRQTKVDSLEPKALDHWQFNPGSNAQLARLFMEGMGVVPKLFTAKGSPSFKSSHLGQWGDPGLMLQARRKKMIVLKQLESLLAVSEFDGLYHIDLKAAGTSTGRMAGGSYG